MPDLRSGVVVITGASSGVGRATARAFAERGARLVLAARGAEALDRVVHECRMRGGHAIGVPTDVSDREAVQRLAGTAAATFGGIDLWINNAGVGAAGRYWEVPMEDHLQTIGTNLLAAMYGAYAVLPLFFEQGRGILINNVSIGGFVPVPLAAAYTASKFGLRGFSDSLRQEVAGWPDIHVCAVYPYLLDTPGLYHTGNYTGRALRPTPFVYRPETVAQTMLRLAEHPRPEVMVGIVPKLVRLEHQIAPRSVEWALGRTIEAYLNVAEASPITSGNLHRPSGEPRSVHGGWRKPARRAAALAVLGLAAGASAVWGIRGWERR